MLYALDKAVFLFFNRTIANPLFDAVMPPITDWNKHWIGIALFASLWILIFWRGGKKGRILMLLLIPLITLSDQVSSTFVKNLVARPRPCHIIEGHPEVADVRLLVPCGGGFSFPSSHACNNFAFATFLAFYYRRWRGLLFGYATVMALSRMIVGVHYPSDVLGGLMLGVACAYVLQALWDLLGARFSWLVPADAPRGSTG